MIANRRLPVGAEILKAGGAHFRLWAPKPSHVKLVLQHEHEHKNEQPGQIEFDMTPEGNGYFSCVVPEVKAGSLYCFRLDNSTQLYPDPVARFQPEGPDGPSQLVDPESFRWTDANWKGVTKQNRIIYEMHIGTFTLEGTYQAAAKELPELSALGITVIELMPVAEFAGKFGWGYDGVALFAPYHHYGTPDDLRYFVNCAHAVGIGVILDVVYNHCGPSGCYLRQFSDDYFSDRYKCEWGDAINFDGKNSAPVREFYIANAGYWIEEFHLDGLRLDATQQMFDDSAEHVIAAITRQVRKLAGARASLIVGENEPQHARVVRTPEEGGYGLDCVWNDDFHHSASVVLKGQSEAYFTDYRGNPQEFISSAKRGYLYQGQWYRWQKQRRGLPAFDLAPTAFIHYIQNHDQVANSGFGRRIHQVASPGVHRAMTALLLLGPATPMLFQGQEFSASAPFHYFADHNPELARLVRTGRTEFLHQFPSLAAPETQAYLHRPDADETFTSSKLDLTERERHGEAYALHKDLIKLRRDDPVFSNPYQGGIDGAVLSPEAFVLRFFSASGDADRLLMVNFGRDLMLSPIPEPLLAPHENADWSLLWSSEHPRYGGHGTTPLDTTEHWHMPGHAALVLTALTGRRIGGHMV